MNPWMIPLGVTCVLSLACIALCLFVLYRSRVVLYTAGQRAAADHSEIDQRLQTIAAQVQELQQEPPMVTQSGPLKPGFNLSKRSQALRMHRRGDQPQQIAAALEVPAQEIELLLKVHRIVLSSI